MKRAHPSAPKPHRKLLPRLGVFLLAPLFHSHATPLPVHPWNAAWEATHPWDARAEEEFSGFVARIGAGREARKCMTFGACLSHPEVNPFYATSDGLRDIYADCADVPYMLRAYFAYKTKRPFAYTAGLRRALDGQGNVPSKHRTHNDVPTFKALYRDIMNTVHTGFLRVSPSADDSETYPVDILRESIRPGTIFNDPQGHALVVYKVGEDGIVSMFDGNTDNSMTIKRIPSEALKPGEPLLGGGFRNWRPVTVPPADAFSRASPEFVSNARLPDHSGRAQYFGRYLLPSHEGSYWDWVRFRLARGEPRIRPVQEFTLRVEQLCDEINERNGTVELSVKAGLPLRPAVAVPRNIYSASGDWGRYSTPSKDVKIRGSLRELKSFVGATVQATLLKDGRRTELAPSAHALVSDYREAWARAMATPGCNVAYQDSAGQTRSVTLDDVAARAYALSFDPSHCPEMRWGEPGFLDRPRAAEGSPICRLDDRKKASYQEQQRARRILDRSYMRVVTLEDGPEFEVDLNVPAFLNALAAGRVPMAAAGAAGSAATTHSPISISERDLWDRFLDMFERL